MGAPTAHAFDTSFRPEVELLLSCADTSIDTKRAERIRRLLRIDLDWDYLLQTAGQHGVLPLLSRNLRLISPTGVPQTILEQLHHHFRTNAARNLFLTDELLKLLKLLEAHAIPVLPYKGPLLTASIYGNLALRDFADLDLLVHERDYPRTQRLLRTSGYRPMNTFEWESTYVDEHCNVIVDLHQRISPRELPSPLQFQDLWARRRQTVLLGTTVCTLSPEDSLIMVAVQMTKDAGTAYLQLARVCDMSRLLRAYPDLDLIGVVRRANELGGERMVLFSLCLAHTLLGTPLPPPIVQEAHTQPAIHHLVDFARQRLFDREERDADNQRSIDQFRWLARERLRDKLHPYYLRYIYNTFVPCSLDRQLVPLPQRFAFLYYGIRPIRLLCKYSLLLFRGRLGTKMS
ncbi:MAG: hypothetical protein OJF51_003147 [Nitrospira sp.]|jgi:hypothetical protein|nr:MAG: hypothetical protein OJF51_003147 [Nitrospira sp.]